MGIRVAAAGPADAVVATEDFFMQETTINEQALRIYLNDHLGASVGAVEWAEHCLARTTSGALRTFLQTFLSEVKEEQAVVQDMMDRIGGTENLLKQATAWVAEKAHRLKPNDDLLHYTDLKQLEALESIGTAVSGKQMLWKGFAVLLADEPRFEDIDFQFFAQRSKRQLAGIEQHRLVAARCAFLSPATDAEARL